MTKEGLAVGATFLVAEVRKEMSCSKKREEDAGSAEEKPKRGVVLFLIQA